MNADPAFFILKTRMGSKKLHDPKRVEVSHSTRSLQSSKMDMKYQVIIWHFVLGLKSH